MFGESFNLVKNDDLCVVMIIFLLKHEDLCVLRVIFWLKIMTYVWWELYSGVVRRNQWMWGAQLPHTLPLCKSLFLKLSREFHIFHKTLSCAVHYALVFIRTKVDIKKYFWKSVKVYWESVVGKGGAACRVPLSGGKRCLVEGGWPSLPSWRAGTLSRPTRPSGQMDLSSWRDVFLKLEFLSLYSRKGIIALCVRCDFFISGNMMEMGLFYCSCL